MLLLLLLSFLVGEGKVREGEKEKKKKMMKEKKKKKASLLLFVFFFLPEQADDVKIGRDMLLGLGQGHELELVERPASWIVEKF